MTSLPFVCLLVAFLLPLAMASEQYTVVGRLMCGGKAYSGANVKLVDNDKFTADDTLDTTKSGANGEFKLQGSVGSEWFGGIDPVLKIYHRCNYPTLSRHVCPIKLRFRLPQKDEYKTAEGQFNFGVFNLEAGLGHDNEYDCIH